VIDREDWDRSIPRLAGLQLLSRKLLITAQMVGNPHIGLCAGKCRGVSESRRDPIGQQRNLEQTPSFAGAAVQSVESAQKPKLVLRIADRLRQLEAAPERGFALMTVPFREHRCVSERPEQLHLYSVVAETIVERAYCATGPDATLFKQI
jgi:hypothetical protein